MKTINETEHTVLIYKKDYDEHMKKVERLIKNNRRMKKKIKNIQKTITDCQYANKQYKSKLKELRENKRQSSEMYGYDVFWGKKIKKYYDSKGGLNE